MLDVEKKSLKKGENQEISCQLYKSGLSFKFITR